MVREFGFEPRESRLGDTSKPREDFSSRAPDELRPISHVSDFLPLSKGELRSPSTEDHLEIYEPHEVREAIKSARSLYGEIKGFAVGDDTPAIPSAVDRFVVLSRDLLALNTPLTDWNASGDKLSTRQQLGELSRRVSELEAKNLAREPVSRSWIRQLGDSALRLTISTVAGAALGGPAVAFTLGDPWSSKIVEGALGGFAGGIANEGGFYYTRHIEHLRPTSVPLKEPPLGSPDESVADILARIDSDEKVQSKDKRKSGPGI